MSQNITNPNNLYGDKFKLIFMKLPTCQYFSKSINLPGLSQNAQDIFNPVNKFHVGSNKVNFDNLTLTFNVDEDLKNYIEIFEWIVGITAPNTTDEHRTFLGKQQAEQVVSPSYKYNIYSDATLMTLTNASNKNVAITFRDMFPVSLSGLEFGVDRGEVLNATATFTYTSYAIEVN